MSDKILEAVVPMVQQNNIHLTWHDILWRLLLTVFLLIVLAGSSITIFKSVTSQPASQVLPTLTHEALPANWGVGPEALNLVPFFPSLFHTPR